MAAATGCIAPTASSTGALAAYGAPSAVQSTAGSSPTVIVSDASQNDVVICGSGSPCSQCKTLGSGLSSPGGVTTSGNGGPPAKSPLGYVADSGNHRVVVFTDTCSTVRILNDASYTPLDVAVAGDGTVAVTNMCETSSCSGPNIAFFAPKSSKITRVATGLMSEYLFGAFDKKGDFYNDGYSSGSTVEVGVVPRNGTKDEPTGISGIAKPAGIQIAKNGAIDILDQACPCIRMYEGNTSAGTVTLTGVTTPVTFALDKKNKHLWVTDVTSQTVDELRYPKGGKILYQYTGFSEPIGVGIIPPAPL